MINDMTNRKITSQRPKMERNTKKKAMGYGKKIEISNLSPEDEKILNSFGIKGKNCLSGLFSMELYSLSGVEKGIGMINTNYGYEFLNQNTKKQQFGLAKTGYVFIGVQGKKRTQDCCVFYDLKDYLSYLGINQNSPLSLPKGTDCFILCGAINYFGLVVDTDEYENINVFMPNSVFGKSLVKTMQERNPNHIKNFDVFYGGYKTLYEYYNNIKS